LIIILFSKIIASQNRKKNLILAGYYFYSPSPYRPGCLETDFAGKPMKGLLFVYPKGFAPHISDKMLTTQLRELEADGFIERKVYAVVPPMTEYSITEKGRSAVPVVETIRNYGIRLMEQAGVDVGHYQE
jgi:hypothetical protein